MSRRPHTPKPWVRLSRRYPDVISSYESLREACHRAGPLDETSASLVKLALAVGMHNDSGVHMQAKKAMRAGADVDALRQVALIALPSVGLANALDALRWIDESIEEMAEDARQKAAGSRRS